MLEGAAHAAATGHTLALTAAGLRRFAVTVPDRNATDGRVIP